MKHPLNYNDCNSKDKNEYKCFHAEIINKRTLETAILNYNEDGTKLGVVNSQYGDMLFEYGSSEALLGVISECRNRYRDEDYVWSWTKTSIDMEDIARGNTVIPKHQVLHLFTPRGQLTRAEKMLEGQRKIPCKKRVFVKKATAAGQIFCDESGRRIFKRFFKPLSVQYLWTFNTDEEMQATYDNIKNEYLNDGYELTFEETVDYAFDYSLESFKQFICEIS